MAQFHVLFFVRPLCASMLALLLFSCTTAYKNVALQHGEANPERRTVIPTSAGHPTILMAFSGGGARASALAAAVLAEMRRAEYQAPDGRRNLTQDVALISSVSGGSVTAAWFGLHRAEKLDEFKDLFLSKNNMWEIKRNLIDPAFWAKEAFTSYSRIDALEALMDKRLFGGKQMSDINKPDHPIIVLNASDLAGGETFAFTPSRFDDICSKLDVLKLSTVVSASAAFPILLAPINLKNFRPNCEGETRNAGWTQIELSKVQGQLNVTEYRNARYTNDLRRGPGPFRDIQYLHLLDGGLADNLGLNTIRDALTRQNDQTGLLRAINDGAINRLVVIVVNARSDPPNKLYAKADASGLVGQFSAVVSVPIDANSQNSQQNLDQLLTEFARSSADDAGDNDPALKVYNIAVDFDLLAADTVEHRILRDAAKAIPTTWDIKPSELTTIEAAVRQIMSADACYQALLGDLGASGFPRNSTAFPCKSTVRRSQ